MTTQIRRDAFARETLLRSTMRVHGFESVSCSWCGNPGRPSTVRGSTDRFLYRYMVERDGISTKPQGLKGLFCNLGCASAYHGGL